jgi:agmatinase
MDPADLLRAIRQVALHTPVVAMDVVEVAPANDPAELTAQNANRCIMEFISAVAAKRRGARGMAALAEPSQIARG